MFYQICLNGVVFARMAPEEKMSIVEELQALEYDALFDCSFITNCFPISLIALDNFYLNGLAIVSQWSAMVQMMLAC